LSHTTALSGFLIIIEKEAPREQMVVIAVQGYAKRYKFEYFIPAIPFAFFIHKYKTIVLFHDLRSQLNLTKFDGVIYKDLCQISSEGIARDWRGICSYSRN
jgi:hypothetical protein